VVAEARGRGATLDDVRAAADAAYAAAAADNAYGDVDAYVDARDRALARCARIVRRHYPHPPRGVGR
jgi:hypothetical protein